THYWRERYFSDDYLGFDEATEGAADFVRTCYDAGASLIYLTSRDVPGMLIGTMASLRDNAFPVAVAGVGVILKPDATMGDEAFKRSVMPTLDRAGEVVAFFDNEPANCNMARQLYPDAIVGL